MPPGLEPTYFKRQRRAGTRLLGPMRVRVVQEHLQSALHRHGSRRGKCPCLPGRGTSRVEQRCHRVETTDWRPDHHIAGDHACLSSASRELHTCRQLNSRALLCRIWDTSYTGTKSKSILDVTGLPVLDGLEYVTCKNVSSKKAVSMSTMGIYPRIEPES